MSEIRVRIAPSPTGNLHLGTARSALFNYLFAKKNKGKFILRIEDTDIERSDKKFEKDIIDGLSWLNIEWDEGPEKNYNNQFPISKQIPNSKFKTSKQSKFIGNYGPYRQSERLASYRKYIKKLLDEGKAYYCFCSKEELERERKESLSKGEAPIYSGKCRNLSEEEIEKLQKEGKKSIIRFKTPEKKIVFNDLIRGRLEFDTKLIGDISIAKDINTPLYNFAVVVDDYEMKISHVIRGEDHISNTPKQILIAEALGFNVPQYAHLPLILGPDRSKLSKRHGATSLTEYEREGYLSEAMVNFMAFLGWNPGDEREIFSLEELVKEFDLRKVNKSGAIFNIEKLNNINSHYIRETNISVLTKKCLKYLEEYLEKKNDNWVIKDTGEKINMKYLEKIVALEQERVKKLSEIGDLTAFFFKKDLNYNAEMLVWKKSSKEETFKNLDLLKDFLEDFKEEWNKDSLEKLTINWLKENDFGIGDFLWPMRVALSGEKNSPGPFEIADVLGKEKTLKRIEEALKMGD